MSAEAFDTSDAFGLTSLQARRAFLKFICTACGLIYDEAQGDVDSGLAPGTRFEDIPDDWMCPICGVGKADFVPWEMQTADIRSSRPANLLQRPVVRKKIKPILILGAGTAGWAVAAAIRQRDRDRELLMLSACGGCIYPKPILSVAIAQGKAVPSLISENGQSAARRLNLRLVADTWLTGIDRVRRKVRSTRGSFEYGELVLAIGATPTPLPLDAASLSHIWRINHYDHYRRFRAVLDDDESADSQADRRVTADAPGQPSKRIVIVGAGLVGCELADDIAATGHSVTLLDINAAPLAALAAPEVAAELVRKLAEHGTQFIGGVRVSSVRRVQGGLQVSFDKGTIVADQVISATGLEVDQRLARMTALDFRNGFLVDAHNMKTSDPAIYALGDCASFAGQTFRFIEPIQRQAKVIADRICGVESQGFDARPPVIRLKSRSMPITLRSAGCCADAAKSPTVRSDLGHQLQK